MKTYTAPEIQAEALVKGYPYREYVPLDVAQRLLEALKAVEFSDDGICSWCGQHKEIGHSPECIIGKAIAAAEKE